MEHLLNLLLLFGAGLTASSMGALLVPLVKAALSSLFPSITGQSDTREIVVSIDDKKIKIPGVISEEKIKELLTALEAKKNDAKQ
jgi:CHASE2 domain-containing sensor protein